MHDTIVAKFSESEEYERQKGAITEQNQNVNKRNADGLGIEEVVGPAD